MYIDFFVFPAITFVLILSNTVSYQMNRPVLYDPIHEMFKYHRLDNPFLIYCKDLLTFLPMGMLASYDLQIFLVACRIYALTSLFRPFCFLSTCLPCPNNRTKEPKTPIQTLNGSRGDLIYSGHITLLSSAVMTIYEMYDLSILTAYVFIPTYVLVCGFLTTVTRSHYTVDIVVAILVTWLFSTAVFSGRPGTYMGALSSYVLEGVTPITF